ncbi:MAG: HNH endonuclease signature motif containing protein [Bdellovibrionota bacterium]
MGSKKKEKSVPLDLCKNNSIAPSLAPSMIGEKSKVGDKADSSENVQVKINLEEQFFNFRFVAGKQLREKLLRLAEVMNVTNMELNLAEILEESVDLALQQKDPQLKEERRKARLQKKKFAEREQRKDEGKKAKTKEEQNKKDESSPREKVLRDKEEIEQEQQKERGKEKLRYIPAKIRAQVLERAGYQCEKVGVNEIRCTAKTCLEIDHIAPFARGGNHALSNLQVLCKAHNSNKAKQEFGYEFIAKKILASKLAGCFASNS